MPDSSTAPAPTNTGLGRVLILVYAVFALSATGRSTVQLVQKADDAPLAYALSAFAAAVYIMATYCLAKPGPRTTRLAWVAVSVELVGVLVIGTLSIVEPSWFPDDTVWSDFGSGYGWVPLVLPFLGLAWLFRTARPRAAGAVSGTPTRP